MIQKRKVIWQNKSQKSKRIFFLHDNFDQVLFVTNDK